MRFVTYIQQKSQDWRTLDERSPVDRSADTLTYSAFKALRKKSKVGCLRRP